MYEGQASGEENRAGERERKLSFSLTSARPSAAGWAACLSLSVSFVAVPRILAYRSSRVVAEAGLHAI
jgi:hypothetical protein